MRILHLTTFLDGSDGRVIVDLAGEQARLGHELTVVSSRTGVAGHDNDPRLLAALRAAGVFVHEADSLFHRDFEANLSVARLLSDVFPAGAAPDVIHAHDAVPTFIGRLFLGARACHHPIVQTMHGWGASKSVSQAAWDIGLMNLADRVAVPSAHSAQLLASRGLPWSKITVVPYGTRPDAVEPDEADLAALADIQDARRRGGLVLACAGTVGARRNPHLLIDALARLSGGPRLQAILIGAGDADQLARDVREAEAAQVRVRGVSAAARQVAAACDAIVLPSSGDGQPLAILEAFADGVLVVACDSPELRELVEDGVTGLTFGRDDAGALASALTRLSVMPASARDALRTHARARYAAAFSLPAMVRNYLNLYHLARRGRRPRAEFGRQDGRQEPGSSGVKCA